MSATDELRRLLDERDVEWVDGFTINMLPTTGWMHGDIAYSATAISGKLKLAVVRTVTPEQAIEITLGRGECELQETCDDYVHIGWCRCSACGGGFPAYPVNFCPNCGRKVRR